MAKEIAKVETPEERELHKKLAELADLEMNLAQRELDLATLKAELNTFEALYFRIVGVRYAELDEIKAQIAETKVRMNPGNRRIQEEAAHARSRAQESSDAAEKVQEQDQEKFTPSEELKRLYRDIAMRIHPDLAEDEAERIRRHELMSNANNAYEEGDEERLRAILDEWENSPESVKGDGIGADLVRIIRKISQIQKRLKNLETEIAEIESSDLYQLKTNVEEAQKEGKDLLEEMAEAIEKEIRQARTELDKLKGNETTL